MSEEKIYWHCNNSDKKSNTFHFQRGVLGLPFFYVPDRIKSREKSEIR